MKSLNILAQSTPLKKLLKDLLAVLEDQECLDKVFSADIRYEIFGRASLNCVLDGNEYCNNIVDLDEPYSKSIYNKSFYLQVVAELSSLIFKHRNILFSKYRSAPTRKRDILVTEASNESSLAVGMPIDVKIRSSSSQTSTTFYLSLSDDSDDGDDNIHHLASFNTNIEKNENRIDWITYMKSSVSNRHCESQSVT